MSENIWKRLAAPLDPRVIKTREQAGKTLRYIDSRTVDDILDANALGEWNVTMTFLGSRPLVGRNGEDLGNAYAIKASLTVYGVTREDVGEGKDFKAAASDALKRAAVRFGIGRELYGNVAPAAEGEQRLRPTPQPSAARGPEAATGNTDSTATPATSAGDFPPPCPKCGGKMWDNRASKRNPKAPDAKCRDRACDGVMWPEKPTATTRKPKPGEETDEEYAARLAAIGSDDLPF